MSTAKRLVLSLRGRKDSQQTTAGTASSTRLVSGGAGGGGGHINSTNNNHHFQHASSGHELDEIAVVSGLADSSHALYGSMSQSNGPRYVTGERGGRERCKMLQSYINIRFLTDFFNALSCGSRCEDLFYINSLNVRNSRGSRAFAQFNLDVCTAMLLPSAWSHIDYIYFIYALHAIFSFNLPAF